MTRASRFAVWLVLAFAWLLLVSSAGATQAFRYLDDTFSSTGPWDGTRSTINNPADSQRQISPEDFMLTSVYADDGPNGENLIQTGVVYEYKWPRWYNCTLGDPAPAMYYFTEVEDVGVPVCYSNGIAPTTDSWRQAVLRADDGFWRSYRGGASNGITTRWDEFCGGKACRISTFGEEGNAKPGEWYAKFSGGGGAATGNTDTPWQRNNGGIWGPPGGITESQFYRSSVVWSTPQGPYPEGIWYLRYFCCPTAETDYTFDAVGDAYVEWNRPTTNFGSESFVRVEGPLPVLPTPPRVTPENKTEMRDALIKFSVSALANAGMVLEATLRLCPLDAGLAGGEISTTVDASWDEHTVTWFSSPAASTGSVSIGPVVAGTCTDVDVTDLVWNAIWPGVTELSFRITGSLPTKVDYASREAGADLQPRLTVKTDY